MNAAVENVRDSAAPALQQVLTFTLGDESFGVEILRVQEIRGWSRVTQMLLDVDRLLVTDAQRSYSLN